MRGAIHRRAVGGSSPPFAVGEPTEELGGLSPCLALLAGTEQH
jgi:hypothetical protein